MIYSLLLDDKRALVSDDISKVLNLPFKHTDSLSITQLLMQLMRLAFETIASNNMFVILVPFHKSL